MYEKEIGDCKGILLPRFPPSAALPPAKEYV